MTAIAELPVLELRSIGSAGTRPMSPVTAGVVASPSITVLLRPGAADGSRGHALAIRLRDACLLAGREAWIGTLAESGGSAVVVDACGEGRSWPGCEVWQLRVGGAPIHGHRALSASWQRRPHSVAVTLTRSRPGTPAETIGRAYIGTSGSLSSLHAKVGATAALLLHRALSDRPLVSNEDDEAAPTAAARHDGVVALLAGWWLWQMARWRSRLFAEWWTIGICDRPLDSVLATGQLGPVHWLRPRPGKAYWADPFPWLGTDRILCELCATDGASPGEIVALRQGSDGTWTQDSVLMADRWHRSYPLTWTEAGEVYLLPECVDGDEILLHRLGIDGRAKPFHAIARGRFADATLFAHDRRYWVAATDLDVGGHDNLCLFHSERLVGPWQAHPHNPVKLDIRSSRSAGTPFVVDGQLFRPAQDCAVSYGAAVAINRVLTLTPDEFVERVERRLAPDAGGLMPHGLHTLAAWGERTLVDGKRMVFMPNVAWRKVTRRLLRAVQR